MAAKPPTIRVFYSWQSDLPDESNRNAIRRSIDRSINTVSKTVGRKLKRDEATRDTSGSPNIALKVLEKIDHADIFVADVTPITARRSKVSAPNANVVFELGYAVGQLGWDRIILLFNRNFGQFPRDLPFDFVQNRASPFSIEAAGSSSQEDELAELLRVAIAAVVKKNPKRPSELKGLAPERVRHDRDADNIRWLMSAIHLPTVDELIQRLPGSITDRSFYFYEEVVGIWSNSLFNLYDETLKSAVDRLVLNWHEAMSHDQEYNQNSSGILHIWHNPGDLPLPKGRQEVWDAISVSRGKCVLP